MDTDGQDHLPCPGAQAARRGSRPPPSVGQDLLDCELVTAPQQGVDVATDLPGLQRFAQRLERDLEAVIAGLAQPWIAGVVEGHVNRVKMLMRHMFGLAGFDLSRDRVLLA
ncbi:hypothetical protein Save01_04068 [Streptomyces avermitilis]|uniref:Transposase IS204/IS1001/IS1096/IS1165 DDE domain-containing protein n=1 Tax=Streptomyces avermitilis (strain ATCC 31267 / DSM 46492 / JCM 5070 / NBRC 14893 / NCIMB 12804 / NRRL 8165 / MA-4680) TaxID=227882 RepID=Q82QH1_STRAW|nr:hypothetical protein SAVERM_535 [Streptomyces avermitilis MA-4680 = NBRC 14893]